MDAGQLETIRALVNESGYLPYSNKAMRLLAFCEQHERARTPADASIASLRQGLEENGYLPFSRAMELVSLAESALVANRR